MTDEIHDTSRLDSYLRARQKVALLNASWKPVLAGAAGAEIIIACAWVAMPRFTVREVEVPKIVMRDAVVPNIVQRDVTVDHIIPRDLEIPIPRIVTATPAPLTGEERAFEDTDGWRESVIRGRILREDRNGFVLATDQGERVFYPAKVGPGGKIEFDPGLKDLISPFLNSLAFCRPQPIGVYRCTALAHDGREVAIPEVPLGAPL